MAASQRRELAFKNAHSGMRTLIIALRSVVRKALTALLRNLHPIVHATDSSRSPHAHGVGRRQDRHTVAWGFFAGCILAIPVVSWWGRHVAVAWLSAIVLAEVVILVANGWRCPLTAVAARFTEQRHDNFDIYLPLWLARHNKLIFGALYLLGMAFAYFRWRNS